MDYTEEETLASQCSSRKMLPCIQIGKNKLGSKKDLLFAQARLSISVTGRATQESCLRPPPHTAFPPSTAFPASWIHRCSHLRAGNPPTGVTRNLPPPREQASSVLRENPPWVLASAGEVPAVQEPAELLLRSSHRHGHHQPGTAVQQMARGSSKGGRFHHPRAGPRRIRPTD